MTTVGEVLDALDRRFPGAWAEPWDNPGLQVGDPAASVSGVHLAVDPTPEVVEEALAQGSGLLIAHHPLLFEPVRRIDLSTAMGRLLAAGFQGLAVAACHTNADVAPEGVSVALAKTLGVNVEGPLQPTQAGDRAKVVTFVPEENAHEVLEAMARAGAGGIGAYDVCSFRAPGTGTFRPSRQAHPRVGRREVINEVAEVRLEMVAPTAQAESVAAAAVEAHPYEEPAVEIVPLLGKGRLGFGIVGALREPTNASDLVARCDEALGSQSRLAGDGGARVERVAVCGGSGASLLPAARNAGVDAYVTADVKHHDALDARANGPVLIDAGHFATERPWLDTLAGVLQEVAPGLRITVSDLSTDPFVP